MEPFDNASDKFDIAHVALLTPEWLSDALQSKWAGVHVTSVTPVYQRVGFAVMIWLHLEYDNPPHGIPKTMVAKGSFGRYGPEMQWAFAVEMVAYRDMVPTLSIASPQVYYAGLGPEAFGSLILMENMRDVSFNSTLRPLDQPTAKTFIDALARMHARWWNHHMDGEAGTRWEEAMVPLREQRAVYHAANQSSERFQEFLCKPRGAVLPEYLRDSETIKNASAKVAEIEKRFDYCMIAGDEHIGNTFITSDGQPGFYDFQSRYAPWSQSYSYFVISALDIEDRRAWEVDFLHYYLERLSFYGVSPPSFDEAWFAYRCHFFWGLWVWLLDSPDFQPEEVCTVNCQKFATAINDHNSLELVGDINLQSSLGSEK